MATVSYPSDDFPALVGVSVDCPDGWNPLPDTGQLLAVVKSVPEGQFRPNLIVSIRRLRRGTGLAQAKAEFAALVASKTDYASVGEEDRLIDGWPGFRAEGSYTDQTAGTVVQAIRFVAVDRGRGDDLVQITATCHATQVPDTWEAIRAIQESLTIVLP